MELPTAVMNSIFFRFSVCLEWGRLLAFFVCVLQPVGKVGHGAERVGVIRAKLLPSQHQHLLVERERLGVLANIGEAARGEDSSA